MLRRCLTCSATVEQVAMPDHEQWHDRIAAVAIENTKRIDALVRALQLGGHLDAGI